MILAASFFLSLAALAFEVLLARIFAFSQWNHLSFMVISIALFGFAASGTLLSLIDSKKQDWRVHAVDPRIIAGACLLFAVSLAVGIRLYDHMPLDYFKITLQPIQILYLLCAYLLLAAPFLITGGVINAAFAVMPQKSGLVYAATMAGSACGALMPSLCLPVMDIGWLLLAMSVCPPAAVMAAWAVGKRHPAVRPGSADGRRRPSIGAAVVPAVVIAGLTLAQWCWPLQFRSSEYKAIYQTLRFPDTHVARTTHGIRGRFDTVRGPYIRHVPGLSLAHTDPPPDQTVMFKDGDRPLVLFHLDNPAQADFARSTLSFIGYAMPPRPQSALILQFDGGLAVPCSLAADIGRIVIASPAAETADRIQTHYGLAVRAGPIRNTLRHLSDTYDVVHVENWGTSLPGTAVLDQDHSLTIEALCAYWRRLSPHGRIVISRKLLLPAADMVRLWANAHESMQRMGVARPADHIAVFRNWDCYTLIVSKSPLNRLEPLTRHAGRHYFDAVYLPDIRPAAVNRYAVLEAPHFADTLAALASAYDDGHPSRFERRYPLDVAPQSDDRPFPYRFIKWRHAPEAFGGRADRSYALLLSGEAVVLVVLAEALLCAVVILLIPALIYRRQLPRSHRTHGLYFLGLGAGFILTELYLIKRFILVFGDPVVSLTVVLVGLLMWTALGSMISQQIPGRRLTALLIVIILTQAAVLGSGPVWSSAMLGLTPWMSYGAALMFMAPIGILLGIPFPLGMRTLVHLPVGHAFAWAANGIASVTGSILAAQIGIGIGISAIMAAAIGAYGLALISLLGHGRSTGPSWR